jgi:hypothetical protein
MQRALNPTWGGSPFQGRSLKQNASRHAKSTQSFLNARRRFSEQETNVRRLPVRHLLLAATALAMLSGAAYAQTSTSGSNSSATNSSGSQSSAVSSPRVTVSGNSVGNSTSSSTSGATANTRSSSTASSSPRLTSTTATNVYVNDPGTGTTSGTGLPATAAGTDPAPTTANVNTNYSGGYTVRNTPEVIAPNVLGGNPCAIGASGGLSLPGFGFSAGTTWADKACERRQQAALLFNMGEPVVARELMCQDDQVRIAMKIGGRPCVADAAVAQEVAPATVAQAAAAPVRSAGSALPATPRPEWCSRAAPSTEASREYVAKACR